MYGTKKKKQKRKFPLSNVLKARGNWLENQLFFNRLPFGSLVKTSQHEPLDLRTSHLTSRMVLEFRIV